MAVLQMNKISICAVKKDRKQILEYLQLLGCVEVRDCFQTDAVFDKADTSSTRTLLKKNAQTAHEAAEILGRYSARKKPSLGFLRGRSLVTTKQYDAFCERRDDTLRTAQRILSLERCIEDAHATLNKLDAQEDALASWMTLPVPQSFKGTKYTAVYIGSVEGQFTAESLLARFNEAAPELNMLHIQIVSSSKEQTCFYLIALREDAPRIEEALCAVGFSLPASIGRRVPAEERDAIKEQREQANEAIRLAEQEIASFQSLSEDLEMLEDHMRMREEKYGVIEQLMQSKHVFVLSGFIPARDCDRLQKKMSDRFECAIQIESAVKDADAPVALQNSRFSEPTESILESYSMPSHSEIDPTPVMSVFYYLMFGLMFADAAYGLIMALACGAGLLLFKNMEYNWKKNLRLFFWCGVSTLLWGIVFASYFGDAIQVIAKTYFGRDVSIPPLWFAPLDRPMQLLVFCLGLGFVHLTTGYLMKAFNYIKNKQYIDIVFDTVFPLVIALSMILVLMNSEMFLSMAGFKLTLNSSVTNACLIAAVVCIVGIVLTSGRESRNWFKRLLKGLYGLYNVLAGWISDILSYSRLLALGLASGVIATVLNTLGTMTGTSIIGVLAFLIIFAAGHALNFGINVLGAYVHSNRLEFVEFFGKFYEGGGRKFAPYGIHTNYYRIVEEENPNV